MDYFWPPGAEWLAVAGQRLRTIVHAWALRPGVRITRGGGRRLGPARHNRDRLLFIHRHGEA